MKRAERNTLLFILAITSGSADGWSYIGLGHAFVANMTGNTVLLAVSIFLEHHDVLHPLISLRCYAAGVAFGSFLTRDVKEGSLWSKSTSSVLLVESLILFAATVAWLSKNAILSPRLKDLVLGCVAAAIGLQSGAMLALKLPGIITTYITGTWTTLIRTRADWHRASGRPCQRSQFRRPPVCPGWISAGLFLIRRRYRMDLSLYSGAHRIS